jgi:acetyltransferase
MFASTGNECDVDFASVLEYCVEDPELETIAVFAETIRQPDAFLRAVARAQELGKQIISVSPAVSEAVARAVMSHTASIVGSAEVYASVCQQYGVVQADSIESMLDYCRLLQERKPMKGRRIGVVTQSGGAGVLVASNATDEGFDLPELGPETQEYLKALLPPDASAKNPVDTTAGTMEPDAYGKILQRLVDDDLIDGVIPIIWAGFNQQQVEQVADVYYGQEKPMAPVVAMEPGPLTALGVPVYDDPTRAVRALGVVARANEPMAWTSPSSFEPDAARASAVADLLAPVRTKPFVLESTAKDALAAYGIAVAAERVCADEDEAVAAFEAIGGNVVLKVLSYDLPHKSDSGGLVLDLDSADAVRQAHRELLRRFQDQPATRIEGVLVQEMVSARIELALGLQRDPVFGPMVAIGLGGVLIEIISTPQLLHAPFGLAEARLAVSRVANGRIGHAARGLDEAQQEAFAQGAVALGQLALEQPYVLSVDVNPLLPTPGGMKAVDALLVLEGA